MIAIFIGPFFCSYVPTITSPAADASKEELRKIPDEVRRLSKTLTETMDVYQGPIAKTLLPFKPIVKVWRILRQLRET